MRGARLFRNLCVALREWVLDVPSRTPLSRSLARLDLAKSTLPELT